MKLDKLAIGRSFRCGGVEWTLLDRRGEKHFCLAARIITRMAFDRGGISYFPVSSLYGWLNGSFIDSLAENGAGNVRDELLPLNMDCPASGDDGAAGRTLAGLLSFRQARIYQERIHPVADWWWTCTPCEGPMGAGLRCLAGAWNGGYAYYRAVDKTPGVRPTISLCGSAEVTEIRE